MVENPLPTMPFSEMIYLALSFPRSLSLNSGLILMVHLKASSKLFLISSMKENGYTLCLQHTACYLQPQLKRTIYLIKRVCAYMLVIFYNLHLRLQSGNSTQFLPLGCSSLNSIRHLRRCAEARESCDWRCAEGSEPGDWVGGDMRGGGEWHSRGAEDCSRGLKMKRRIVTTQRHHSAGWQEHAGLEIGKVGVCVGDGQIHTPSKLPGNEKNNNELLSTWNKHVGSTGGMMSHLSIEVCWEDYNCRAINRKWDDYGRRV